MTKELTHRADELKSLGWSADDVNRYEELWDYRQRWGAINLEREDRQFLRKAEAALPEITKTKNSVKKSIVEKSYYRWLVFNLNQMNNFEKELAQNSQTVRGLWPILIEEELRTLDYYEPVLGLPDTLKARLLYSVREKLIKDSLEKYQSSLTMENFKINSIINNSQDDCPKSWKTLREGSLDEDSQYPLISSEYIEKFRKDARSKILPAIRENFPSLKSTDKPSPPDEWSTKINSVAKKEDS